MEQWRLTQASGAGKVLGDIEVQLLDGHLYLLPWCSWGENELEVKIMEP